TRGRYTRHQAPPTPPRAPRLMRRLRPLRPVPAPSISHALPLVALPFSFYVKAIRHSGACATGRYDRRLAKTTATLFSLPQGEPMTILGTPMAASAIKVMLLGSGELGKEVTIALQRLGCEVIAVDRYANAPAMQVAHR